MRRRRPPVEAQAAFRPPAVPEPPQPARVPPMAVPQGNRAQQQPATPQVQRAVPAAAALGAERARRRLAGGRRHHTSKWTFKYWLNAVAGIGLMAEAREMGLTSRRAPSLQPGTATQRMDGAWGRRRRALFTGVVLFVATLVPEVEKRRRRALEKRERIRVMIERARASNPTASPTSTASPPEASSTPERVSGHAAQHVGGVGGVDAGHEDEVSEAISAAPGNASEEEGEDNRVSSPAVADVPGEADDLDDGRPDAEELDAVGVYATSYFFVALDACSHRMLTKSSAGCSFERSEPRER
jgi:hypothetical protein